MANHTIPGQTYSSKRLTSTCSQSFTRNWQLPFLNQQKGENDCRKYFMMNVAESGQDWTHNLMITSRTHIWLSHWSRHNICFQGDKRKLFTWYPHLSRGMQCAKMYLLTSVLSDSSDQLANSRSLTKVSLSIWRNRSLAMNKAHRKDSNQSFSCCTCHKSTFSSSCNLNMYRIEPNYSDRPVRAKTV